MVWVGGMFEEEMSREMSDTRGDIGKWLRTV